jgi:PAP2 superfamily
MKKSIIHKVQFFIVLSLLFFSCEKKSEPPVFGAADCREWNRVLIDAVMLDIFPPMIASRVYTYPQIAMYTALAAADHSLPALTGKLNDFDYVPEKMDSTTIDPTLSAFVAWCGVARKLVFSEYKIEACYKEHMARTVSMDSERVRRSVEAGEKVAKAVIEWMAKDNYGHTRKLARHTIVQSDSTWGQTPPDYPQALEPNWMMIRPMVMDSSSQFNPAPPTAFSSMKESEMYKEAMKVYAASKVLTEEQFRTAWYWDDSPNNYRNTGHNTTFSHKISPGGHWLTIAGSVCRDQKKDFRSTVAIYTMVAIAQFDAFISCWHTKYHYNYIRPVSFINKWIDPQWLPLIQTPGFPEYTSGHSCVSSASATVLTHFFGDEHRFTDSTEVAFDLGAKTFDSFVQAAQEASISRFYGGIHYMPALDTGLVQGRKVGALVISTLSH